jgi:hypothetical protein
MADSDRRQYERALGHWDALHEAKAYSLPPHLGILAIVCSYNTWQPSPEDPRAPYVSEDDPATFKSEALTLADGFREEGKQVEVALDANATDMQDVLRDPSVSDIIIIAHGQLSSVMMNNDDPRKLHQYDWKSVSADANHLKLGNFVHRSCARLKRRLSVPLGLFAVHEHRNVLAPVGHYFAPTDLNHPHNALIRPVTEARRLDYEAAASHFSGAAEEAAA